MQLTAELAPLGYAHRETEFVLIPGTTTRLYGACGPTALASCASAALQKLVTTEQMYTLMRGRGLCDASGVSNDVKLAAAAVIATNQGGYGLAIDEHHAYSGDVWNGWQTFLGWHLGSCDHPTLIELAHGQQLKDEISGLGENASGLTYHFICLIKRHGGGYSAYAGRSLPSGYWACDGDNYAGGNNRANNFHAADALQFYSDETLTAAMPCAGIAFKRAAVAAQPVSGGSTMWHQVSASPLVMADSNGVQAHFGMAGYLAAHTTLGDVVQGCSGETYVDDTTSILPLDGEVSLVYRKSDNAVHSDQSGAVLWSLHQQLAAAKAQIATLESAPPPAPVVEQAPLSAQQQKDLAAMAAIRAALA